LSRAFNGESMGRIRAVLPPPRNGDDRFYMDVFRSIAWLQRTAGYAQTGRCGSEELLAQAHDELERQLLLYGVPADRVNESVAALVMIPCDLRDAESLSPNTAPPLRESAQRAESRRDETALEPYRFCAGWLFSNSERDPRGRLVAAGE
jgi:hypothetical protein